MAFYSLFADGAASYFNSVANSDELTNSQKFERLYGYQKNVSDLGVVLGLSPYRDDLNLGAYFSEIAELQGRYGRENGIFDPARPMVLGVNDYDSAGSALRVLLNVNTHSSIDGLALNPMANEIYMTGRDKSGPLFAVDNELWLKNNDLVGQVMVRASLVDVLAGHVAMSVFDEGDGGLAYDEHFQRRVRLNGHDVIAMDARKTDGSQLLMTLGKFALGTKRDLEEPALVVDVFADKRSGDRTFQIRSYSWDLYQNKFIPKLVYKNENVFRQVVLPRP